MSPVSVALLLGFVLALRALGQRAAAVAKAMPQAKRAVASG